MTYQPAEHLKPRYHVRPSTGWVNDPNGPVVHNNALHLFFQSRPRLSLQTPVEWGHATSTDMVSWVVHESAITPDIHPAARDGVYSGVTVSTPSGLRAFFSGLRSGYPYQTVLTALSSDDGHTFQAPHVAVPDPTDEDDIIEYRDPFVYQAGDRWHMVVGASTTKRRGVILHFVSDDLEDWEQTEEILAAPTGTTPWGWMWECPQIVSGPGGLIALFSVIDAAIEGFGPTLAVPLTNSTSPTDPQLVDYGTAFYAPSVLNRPDAPSILWGWVTESRAENWWLEDKWAGALTLPRVVTVTDNRQVRFQPVDALQILRQEALKLDVVESACVLPDAQVEVVWRLPQTGPGTLTVEFGEAEEFTIALSPDGHSIVIDNAHASQDARASGETFILPADRGDTSLRIFIDGSIVEVFTTTGRAATFRVYPTTPPPWRASTSAGSLLGWTLRSSVSDVRTFANAQK